MFFGITSSRSSAGSCRRRQRFREATTRALGGVLADDVAVKLGNDFAGKKGGHGPVVSLQVKVGASRAMIEVVPHGADSGPTRWKPAFS